MKTLHQIGVATGTDKATIFRHGESYLDIYDRILRPMIPRVRRVLEFGTYRGESLRMWAGFFPSAEVVGVDIDPDRDIPIGDRISTITADQIDAFTLQELLPAGEFDVVVDDASHIADYIARTFEIIWPRVSSGGLYIMEDLAATYYDITPGHEAWPGQCLNPKSALQHKRETFDRFLCRMISDLDHGLNSIRSVRCWSRICVVEKA